MPDDHHVSTALPNGDLESALARIGAERVEVGVYKVGEVRIVVDELAWEDVIESWRDRARRDRGPDAFKVWHAPALAEADLEEIIASKGRTVPYLIMVRNGQFEVESPTDEDYGPLWEERD